jgi:hypothetical protein
MLESNDEFLVLINVPGCDEESIDLRFVKGNLKVRAERDEDHEGYRLVSEGRPKRIAETVPVPAEVEVDDAEATYDNGVLRVRLPKAPEAKEPEETVGETDSYQEVGVEEPEDVGFEAEEADDEDETEAEDESDEEEEDEMPSSRDELEDMSYRDLQGVAKKLDIKANQSTEDLVEEISEELDL